MRVSERMADPQRSERPRATKLVRVLGLGPPRYAVDHALRGQGLGDMVGMEAASLLENDVEPADAFPDSFGRVGRITVEAGTWVAQDKMFNGLRETQVEDVDWVYDQSAMDAMAAWYAYRGLPYPMTLGELEGKEGFFFSGEGKQRKVIPRSSLPPPSAEEAMDSVAAFILLLEEVMGPDVVQPPLPKQRLAQAAREEERDNRIRWSYEQTSEDARRQDGSSVVRAKAHIEATGLQGGVWSFVGPPMGSERSARSACSLKLPMLMITFYTRFAFTNPPAMALNQLELKKQTR